MEEKVCKFKNYVKQTMDLMIDAYRWKVMSENCDDETMREKYKNISDTLMNMFMVEHNNIGNMFKGQ